MDELETAPGSAGAVIDLLRGKGLLAEIGLTESHARTMKTRGRIPGEWDTRIVSAAQRLALPISYELLASLRAETARRISA